MHRLEHKVVFVIGPEGFDEGSARAFRRKAPSHQTFGVGPPLTEIVVYVNGRNTRAPAPRQMQAAIILEVAKLDKERWHNSGGPE
jgi:hypothetical protein